jgi:hypothetical protein
MVFAWASRNARQVCPDRMGAGSISAGFTITDDIAGAIGKIPAAAWTPADDAAGGVRDGAWVAEVTGMLNLSFWPRGMRLIVRKERPHPGAQLRFYRHRRAPSYLLRHRCPHRAAR